MGHGASGRRYLRMVGATIPLARRVLYADVLA